MTGKLTADVRQEGVAWRAVVRDGQGRDVSTCPLGHDTKVAALSCAAAQVGRRQS